MLFGLLTENIAAGKVTEQSSTYSDNYTNGTSAKAVDGNSDPDFNHGHCSRTLEDSPSWWRVDLGDRVPVFEVRIVNRLVWSSNKSSNMSNRDYKITLGEHLCSDQCRNVCRKLVISRSFALLFSKITIQIC